jgi:transaldolase
MAVQRDEEVRAINIDDQGPIEKLDRCGQSVWIDSLSRPMVRDGRLEELIRAGVTGITSNPKIFKDAITGSDAYDEQIRKDAARGLSPAEIYENLAVRDVAEAADLLLPVHERTAGEDGFVSLEVSPFLARDTSGSIEEAVRLWSRLDRPNVLIKIPGTAEGILAMRTCLERGINVNVTLLFSLDRYDGVVEAFVSAMAFRHRRGEALDVVSVASFFLSRIDTEVDRRLDRRAGKGGGDRGATRRLRGRAAIASAKLAYQRWRNRFGRDDWFELRKHGARPQRLLWASTSTKDPAYSDVRYVESLVGPSTINTMPEKTLEALLDHGIVEPTLALHVEEDREVLERLPRTGIDLDDVTSTLEREGIRKFREPFEELLRSLERKTEALA